MNQFIDKILTWMVIPQDKALHIIYGIVIFAIAHLIFNSFYTILIVIFISIAKELYDRTEIDKHTVDVWDAVATTAGGLLGFICTLKI